MANKLSPVSINGIEFDALIESTKTMNASVPAYPVEKGFSVSDTIILDPLQLSLSLFVTNTPVTWLKRHGNSQSRVKEICDKIEELWASKALVKVVTNDAIYLNMAITSIAIKNTKDNGYAREIDLTLQKVTITKKKTVKIPSYSLKSGSTKNNGGSASTSSATKSGSSGSKGNSSSGSNSGSNSSGSSGGKSGSGNTSGSGKNSGKSSSTLYKAAKGLGVI